MEHSSEILGFWRYALAAPSDPAVFDVDGRLWSRGELFELANGVANSLLALGISEDNSVALLMPNCAQYLAVCMATAQIGVRLVPLNWSAPAEDVAGVVEDSGAKILIVHVGVSNLADRVIKAISGATTCIGFGSVPGCQDIEGLIAQYGVQPPTSRVAGRFLHYTSGTTGRPKGVVRVSFKESPDTAFQNALNWRRDKLGLSPGVGHRHLCCVPLYHTGSLVWAFNALHMGHAVVLMAMWNPRLALMLIDKWKVTTTTMVPYHFVSLLHLPDELRSRYDVSSLKMVMHASAPCSVETKVEMMRWLGDVIFETYSATEVGLTLARPEEWNRYPGTVGKAEAPHEVKILDESGNEVACGEDGLVYLRVNARTEFSYTYDSGDLTSLRRGDFVTVGDIGYLNADGFLFLKDRATDIVIRNGINIAPAEIENVARACSIVEDCVAFGVHHASWGEDIVLLAKFKQLGMAESSSSEHIATLMRFLWQNLPTQKRPGRIAIAMDVPRNISGKLLRRVAKEVWESSEGR